MINAADPNRPGMHLKLIKFLLKLKAQRIIYVSCNPATCARDLEYLCHGVVCIESIPLVALSLSCLLLNPVSLQREQNIEGRYKLKSVQPVDMFPHTPHIECVCLLELC